MVAAPPAAVAAPKPKIVCKAGTIPKLSGSGAKARLVVRRGTAVCVAPPKAKPTNIEPAATSPQGTVASTTDQLLQALLVKPDALARVEQKLGKKATKALVDQGMNGWRPGMRAQARRLGDAGFHQQTSFGDPAKGTTGSAKIDVDPAGEGGVGNTASAMIEFGADAKGLKELGADKAVSAKSAKVRLEVTFQDLPAACPTADGKVKGTLKASAKLTLTIDGNVTTMAADIQATYALAVGADAHWKTIDDVDVQTTFSFGGSGKGTETWRGRRGGSGFGHSGLFGEGAASSFEAGLKEQQSHLDQNFGGVWGPKSRVLYSDPSTDNVFNYGGSIDHLKGLALTEIATQYLTYAAVEYIRQVVGPRGDRHWYTDEACLKLDATPDKSKLRAGEQATVTAQNAKAADGTPVAVNTTETGVATFEPASAAIPAGGSKGFTLTAPNETPTRSNWQIVALSPAGKKTVTGSLGDAQKWRITLHSLETTKTAGYDGSATMDAIADVEPVPNSNPQQWNAATPLIWSNIVATANDGCTMHSPIAGGSFAVSVADVGNEQIAVQLGFTTDALVSHTIRCPVDPSGFVDTPGMLTADPVALNGTTLVFATTGGSQPIYNKDIFADPDYALSEGTLTVTPIG